MVEDAVLKNTSTADSNTPFGNLSAGTKNDWAIGSFQHIDADVAEIPLATNVEISTPVPRDTEVLLPVLVDVPVERFESVVLI